MRKKVQVRRKVLLGSVVTAVGVVMASAAWACAIYIGQMTACAENFVNTVNPSQSTGGCAVAQGDGAYTAQTGPTSPQRMTYTSVGTMKVSTTHLNLTLRATGLVPNRSYTARYLRDNPDPGGLQKKWTVNAPQYNCMLDDVLYGRTGGHSLGTVTTDANGTFGIPGVSAPTSPALTVNLANSGYNPVVPAVGMTGSVCITDPAFGDETGNEAWGIIAV